MSSKEKLGFEVYVGYKPSVEMLAKIQSVVEECVNKELEEIVRKLLNEKLEEVVKKCLEEKEKPPEEAYELKRIPREEAAILITKYIDEHQGCRTSDIIFDLHLDPDLVLNVLRKLEKHKKVRGEKIESETR